MSSSSQRTSMINPYEQQQKLIKCLTYTQQQKQQQIINVDATDTQSSTSRKRPYNSSSSSMPPSSKVRGVEMSTKSTNNQSNNKNNNTNTIDEYKVWHEISTFIPLFTYGEESINLLNSLLCLPFGLMAVRGAANDVGSVRDCNKSMLSAEDVYKRKEISLSNLVRVLDNMLHTRSIMRRSGSFNMQQQQVAATKSISTPSKKKQKIVKEKSSQSPTTKSSAAVANKKQEVDILPWNVLLRITIRITSHVVNKLNIYDTSSTAGNKERDDEQEERGEGTNVHPLLQVLDIVSGSLHLLTRMQKQQQQQQSQEIETTAYGKNAKNTTPTKSKRGTTTKSQYQLPRDRMLYDWKSNNNKSKSPSRLSPTGREIWGPSRYTFLKDIDTITQLLKVDKDAVSILGINHDEWYERINSIVQVIDECVRVDQQLQFGNDVSLRHESGVQLQQSVALGVSPSLLRYGTKSSLKQSPPKSPSLASITKAHVEHISAQKKDRESCKKKLAFPSSKSADEQVSGDLSVNLQAMIDKESHNPVKMEEGVERIDDEKDSELVDAYRMAIIFGSSNNGVEQDTARETIERRLTILVHKVNTTEEKRPQVKDSDSLNVDGALSYLESLLRTLIKPQDSNVWFKLLSKSDGKETPIMLRRGRSSLISFLIGIKSSGWQDANNQLESSPVPDYLGYLSCSEDAVQPSEQGMHQRSSYFLPAVDTREATLPPSPVVTEIGVSMCIKNFLHKDTPSGSIGQQQPLSKRSPGVGIFKNYEPIQTSSTNMSDNVLCSIETTPLSDVNELTRDLFDLVLRLAADDDVDHENKPFPLRLTTSSPSESLNIVLNVISEHLDWLSPHSIMSRHRFVLQRIMQSSSSESVSSNLVDSDDDDEEGGGINAWSKRASYLIEATKTSNQGQMALYTTQFMMLLCSKGEGNTLKSSFPGSAKQPHFYACLQLRQSSQFWNEIDNSVDDYSANIMTRVLDNEFALQFLLPLSHRCALLLASSTPSLVRNNTVSTSSHSQNTQSIQSLITILTSVLDVVADNGHLQECIHIGWALQMLALTVNHFTFTGVGGDCNTGTNSVWEDISRQLNMLYFSVWGNWQRFNIYQSRTNNSSQDYIVYETIDLHTGTRMVVLMPCFDVFVVSLIKFVCNLKVESNENIKRFCAFIARVLFDRYVHALQSSSNSSKDVHLVEHKWISLLASTLQDMVYFQKSSNESIRRSKDDKVDEETTDQALADLITPALECLHILIMQRVLRTRISRQDITQPSEPVASIFVTLHQQESEKFITKPSSAKTRRWGVYRKCLEQVFTLTPTSVLFACHGNPALTEHSADVLEAIWNQYGQCELSHSISIMVAAALHVNASATSLRSDSPSMGRQDDTSQHLKQLYNNFSTRAKDCIIETFQCFKTDQKIKHQTLDDSQTDINGLIRFVRVELSHHGEAEVGLSWWNEVSSDLLSLLANSKQQANELDDKKKNTASKNIKRKSSTLRNKLSVISSREGISSFAN